MFSFVLAYPHLREHLAQAVNYTLNISSSSKPLPLCLLRDFVRHVTLSTPIQSEPPLTFAYPLITAPQLQSLSMRADSKALNLLYSTDGILSLSLSFREASMHHQFLVCLEKHKFIHTLKLFYYFDYSQLHLPISRRCACHPMRSDPNPLVAACPHVTTFHLGCACQASHDCTFPLFSKLAHLRLSGLLPPTAPPHLLGFAKHLKTLELENAPNIPSLAVSLTSRVTGVYSALHPPHRALSRSQLCSVFENCPSVRHFASPLQYGTLDSPLQFPSSLRSLSFSFRVDSRGKLHKLPSGTLSGIAVSLPQLIEFRASGTRLVESDLQKFLEAIGGRLTLLHVPIHGQDVDLDVWLVCLCDFLVRYCGKTFKEFSVDSISSDVYLQSKRILAASSSRIRRMVCHVELLGKKFPFIQLSEVLRMTRRLTGE